MPVPLSVPILNGQHMELQDTVKEVSACRVASKELKMPH